jgi:hypothetical protein
MSRESHLEKLRKIYEMGTCAHCKTEQPLAKDTRLVLTHSLAPTRMVCDGSNFSCQEDIDKAEGGPFRCLDCNEVIPDLKTSHTCSQCLDCGEVIVGAHGLCPAVHTDEES